VAKIWAEEWATESQKVDWQKLMPTRGFFRFCRAAGWWSAPSHGSQNRRMSKDYERLCATGEAFIYAAMTRLMIRRLARA
jgi:hypothetical protein